MMETWKDKFKLLFNQARLLQVIPHMQRVKCDKESLALKFNATVAKIPLQPYNKRPILLHTAHSHMLSFEFKGVL